MLINNQYESKVLDHLGLVSGMVEELNMVETIDNVIVQDMKDRNVSVGQCVLAMILNGLGYANKRLYLVSKFFESKPIERLIGEGVESSHLNDSVLGRALDDIYDFGVDKLFSIISQQAINILDIKPKYAHIDTSSFSVEGQKYSNDENSIKITYGYSKDNRADLKQAMLGLIVDNIAGVPLALKPLSGNSSDKVEIKDMVNAHISALKNLSISSIVADSAMYSEKNIKELDKKGVKWITRVPNNIVGELIENIDKSSMRELVDGYKGVEVSSIYGVKQRWLILYSPKSKEQAEKTVQKKFLKESTTEIKSFHKLFKERFYCIEDAQKAIENFTKKLKYITIDTNILQHHHYKGKGRPKANSKPVKTTYSIEGSAFIHISDYEETLEKKGYFVLATNELNNSEISTKDILLTYKNQSKVEKGFRFMKDNEFLASAFYVKSPQRIETLMFIMTLCLLVYSALEYKIRQELLKQNKSFIDQKNKSTQIPTMRWIFQYFNGIHLLKIQKIQEQDMVLNLDKYHILIINLLGISYEKYYI